MSIFFFFAGMDVEGRRKGQGMMRIEHMDEAIG